MVLREPLKMRKISGNQTQRHYVRNYTGLPVRLIDTAIEKECFLDELKENTLDVLGVHQRRKKRVTIH
jgi:hypothetical protein